MLLGLRTVVYPVTDLDAAKAWYASLVGHAPYFDQPFYVGFEVGGFELGLMPDGEAGTSGPQSMRRTSSTRAAVWPRCGPLARAEQHDAHVQKAFGQPSADPVPRS